MRSRNIKPGFFQNEELVELPAEVRLLFVGLWCCADREGRLEDRPKKIKMQVFPADDIDVDEALTSLERAKLVLRYQIDGSGYVQICNFVKHQNPHHKEAASIIPSPEGHFDSMSVPSEVTPGQRQRIFDRDGHKCLACGATENLQVNHIVAVSKGGHSGDDNLQTLCASCNAAKGNRSCMDHRRGVNASSKSPDVPLIPDSLIPDSLIPEKRERRSTIPPDDFQVDQKMKDYALSLGLPESVIQYETEKFTDYEFARPYKDWTKVWRNWMRRTLEKMNETHKRTGDSFDEIHARVKARAGLI